jgi:riboflavin synthase
MFTGIVEELGEIVALEWQADGALLTVRGPLVASDARDGDSIAVNGVCLTVVERQEDLFRVDVMNETVKRSALAAVVPGDRVNLERAVTPATRLGGHIVQGHVDGVGTIERRQPGGGWEDITVSTPSELLRYIVEKGSVAVDGISLTVVAVDDAGFRVSLIPTTLNVTTLGVKTVGAAVNIEVDVMAKYVEKLVRPS